MRNAPHGRKVGCHAQERGQGQSVFHNAQELEEFAGAVAEIAEGDGDFFAAVKTQEADGSVAKRGQMLRPMPLFHLAFVFAKRYVSHPMQAIFNAPVTTPMDNQRRHISPLSRKTADGVLDFDRGATLAAGRAFETANLRQTGPIEMPSQPCAGLQMPLNRAAVPLGCRAGFRQRRSSLFLGGGGKIRAENPLPRRLSVRADCL